tara:strand:+ start:134 stop:349 length:216 start_codon:yes stop_codon:yes gene_type:complete
MGEAKRRKELGLPPREKPLDLKIPEVDKKALQEKVRSTLYKYPIIPLLFYFVAIIILVGGSIYFLKIYKVF